VAERPGVALNCPATGAGFAVSGGNGSARFAQMDLVAGTWIFSSADSLVSADSVPLGFHMVSIERRFSVDLRRSSFNCVRRDPGTGLFRDRFQAAGRACAGSPLRQIPVLSSVLLTAGGGVSSLSRIKDVLMGSSESPGIVASSPHRAAARLVRNCCTPHRYHGSPSKREDPQPECGHEGASVFPN